jgi:DHA2 family multidrug resistance protein
MPAGHTALTAMSVTLESLPEASPARAERVIAPARPVNPWLAGVSVLAGVFMVVLDSTVVNVSLPHIAGNLSATVEESTWALTSYLAANAVILPITGWLANYFGRARLLQLAVAGFTIASFLCGLAPTLSFLIACRIVQGMSGGVMQPLSQAVMLESFPPQERGEAMALWGIGIVVAPIFGPVIGGWLTDNYTWRWIFYINIPIGICAFLMIRRFIIDPAYIRRGSARIDYWGIGLLIVGIGALQIALDKGQEEDWFASDWITALAVMAAVALVVLVVHLLLARNPVVDLRVFKDTTYTTGVVLITLMGFVMYGSLVILPILLQTLMGYPPVQAGIAMAPRGLGTLVMTPIIGFMIARSDPRKILSLGFGVGVVTLWWFARLDLTSGYWDYFWPQFIGGMGFAMLFVPLTTTTMDRIANQAMGNATSVFNLLRNIGGSTGIAITQTMLARNRQLHTNVLGTHVSIYSQQTQHMLHSLQSAFMARGADASTATRQAYGALWGMVQKQAAILSFNDAFRLLAVIFLVIMPLALLMRRPRTKRGPHAAAGE